MIGRVQFVLYVIFLTYFLSLNFVYITLLVLAFVGSVRRLQESRFTDFDLLAESYLTIPVSIVIAAYNEERDIVNVVCSALDSIYPEFEVIVVNDGSTDRTVAVLRHEFDMEVEDVFYRRPLPSAAVRRIHRSKRFRNLWMIDKDNGGKADALNAGINLARYRYIVTTDADSVFHRRGLLRIARMINVDPAHIVGVGGQIRVGNGLDIEKGRVIQKRLPRQLVARFQVVEYLGSFLGNRVGWSELNSVLVISGAFGAWRKDTLLELGGMTTETTHEDIEFTFRIHEAFRRRGSSYYIVFLPDPIVWTEVPATWRDLFAQRRRWQRVVNEVFWRYRHMFLNPRYGLVGLLGLPYLLIYEILGPFIETASYLVVALLFALGWLAPRPLLVFLLVSFGLTGAVRLASVFVEQYSFRTFPLRALPRLFLLAVLENFGYHQYVSVARMRAFFDVVRRRPQTWERVRRRGF